MVGVAGQQGNFTASLVATDDAGERTTVKTHVFRVLPRDPAVSAFGQ